MPKISQLKYNQKVETMHYILTHDLKVQNAKGTIAYNAEIANVEFMIQNNFNRQQYNSVVKMLESGQKLASLTPKKLSAKLHLSKQTPNKIVIAKNKPFTI